MFLNIPDLELIQQRRQQLIDANLHRQNQRRRFMDYRVGQQVLLKASDNRKLDSPTLGPFTIRTVHANGTLTIERAPHIWERVHLRRVVPYRL